MEMRRKRGVSFIEVMVVISLTLLFSIILGNVSTISGNSIEKTTDVAVVINKSKIAFEKIVKDVNESDMMLCQYPVNGTPSFTAANDSVIILRQPTFDSSHEPVVNQYKVVIYVVEAAGTANDGPFVLKRHKATINGSTETAPVSDGIVAKNIKTPKIQTAVNQQFWGDYYTTDFYLFTTPQAATPEIPVQFLIGGVDRLADGKAVLAANTVTTFKPMKQGVRADATYPVNPTYQVDGTGNNGGTSLYLKFTVSPQWKSIGRQTKSRDFVFASQPSLNNNTTNL